MIDAHIGLKDWTSVAGKTVVSGYNSAGSYVYVKGFESGDCSTCEITISGRKAAAAAKFGVTNYVGSTLKNETTAANEKTAAAAGGTTGAY
jgi:hypothetical protein